MVIISFRNSQPFGVAVRYYLWQLDKPEQKIVTNIRWDNRDLAEVASLAARGEVNCLIVQDAEGSIDEATDTLGLPRLNHELAMFVWRDGAWERLKSWSVPPSLIQRGGWFGGHPDGWRAARTIARPEQRACKGCKKATGDEQGS